MYKKYWDGEISLKLGNLRKSVLDKIVIACFSKLVLTTD